MQLSCTENDLSLSLNGNSLNRPSAQGMQPDFVRPTPSIVVVPRLCFAIGKANDDGVVGLSQQVRKRSSAAVVQPHHRDEIISRDCVIKSAQGFGVRRGITRGANPAVILNVVGFDGGQGVFAVPVRRKPL